MKKSFKSLSLFNERKLIYFAVPDDGKNISGEKETLSPEDITILRNRSIIRARLNKKVHDAPEGTQVSIQRGMGPVNDRVIVAVDSSYPKRTLGVYVEDLDIANIASLKEIAKEIRDEIEETGDCSKYPMFYC